MFTEGEKKPEKPKKKKVAKGAKANGTPVSAAATPAAATPQGGLTPSTPTSKNATPTVPAALAPPKKRGLEPEVRLLATPDSRCSYKDLPSACQWFQLEDAVHRKSRVVRIGIRLLICERMLTPL